MPFVSKLFPKWHCKRLLRTDPLKALVIGGFVRGLSMRDVESLCEEAGLGKTSKSTVATICAELRERFERSVAARSTTSTWSCCSSTRSTSRSAPAAPKRG
jgi:transposase-like protein